MEGKGQAIVAPEGHCDFVQPPERFAALWLAVSISCNYEAISHSGDPNARFGRAGLVVRSAKSARKL
jgi:hypothetical protein